MNETTNQTDTGLQDMAATSTGISKREYQKGLSKEYDNDLIGSMKDTHRTILKNEEKFYKDLEKQYKKYYEHRKKYVNDFLDSEQKVNQSHNSKAEKDASSSSENMYNINKSSKLATAVMELPSTVSSAFYWGMSMGGPILGAATAASAAATQVENINSIRNSSYSSTSSSYSDGSGSVDTMPSNGLLKEIKIEINGEYFSRSQVRMLLDKMQREIKDGYPFNIS